MWRRYSIARDKLTERTAEPISFEGNDERFGAMPAYFLKLRTAVWNLGLEERLLVKRLSLFAALLGWCAVLLVFRFFYTDSLRFGFLIWNLLLAFIPLVAAILFARAIGRREASWKQLAWFGVWLVFLPNAPYIITDFMHLNRRSPMPVWYDIALLASCAGTGLLLGYSSLAEVQLAIARRFSAAMGWLLAVSALFLSAFGIYLGRFLRWNSWDALTRPSHLWRDIGGRVIDPIGHPRTIGVTLIYGTILLLGYLALRVVQPVISPNESPVSRP